MVWEDEGKGERKSALLLLVRVTNILLQVRFRASSAWFQLKITDLVSTVCIPNIFTVLYSPFMVPVWNISPLQILKSTQGFHAASHTH